MKQKFRRLALWLFSVLVLLAPAAALGGEFGDESGDYNLDRAPKSGDEFGIVIKDLTNLLFTLLLLLAVVFILIAAYRYLTSQGESEKVKEATRSLTYALVAVAVAFLSKGLVLLILSLIKWV